MKSPKYARRQVRKRLTQGQFLACSTILLSACGTSVATSSTTLTQRTSITTTSTTLSVPNSTTTTAAVTTSLAATEAKLESDQSLYPPPLAGTKYSSCPNPLGVGADANPTGQLRTSLIQTTREWLMASSIATRLSLSDRALWAQVSLGPSQNPVMSAASAEHVQIQISRPTPLSAYSGCFAKIVKDSPLIVVCNSATATVAACDPGLSFELYALNRSGHWLMWQELA